MNKCKRCGKPCQDTECPDCRYRNGGKFTEHEAYSRDLVDGFVRHSIAHFRAGFTPDQLQQISPNER